MTVKVKFMEDAYQSMDVLTKGQEISGEGVNNLLGGMYGPLDKMKPGEFEDDDGLEGSAFKLLKKASPEFVKTMFLLTSGQFSLDVEKDGSVKVVLDTVEDKDLYYLNKDEK